MASPDFLTFSADGFQPTRVGKQNVQHLSVSTFGRFLKAPLDSAAQNGNWKFHLEQISHSFTLFSMVRFFFYCIRIRNGLPRLLNERQYSFFKKQEIALNFRVKIISLNIWQKKARCKQVRQCPEKLNLVKVLILQVSLCSTVEWFATFALLRFKEYFHQFFFAQFANTVLLSTYFAILASLELWKIICLPSFCSGTKYISTACSARSEFKSYI